MSGLADRSRTPIPFRQFVLKVHSRCNLACDYCYVYEHADQSWRSQPLVMSESTLTRAAERIAEHARLHRLTDVWVVLHGGEPLLAGRDRLAFAVSVLRRTVRTARVHVSVQTNGVLLDDTFCQLFAELDVKVGISLDGDAAAMDRHRLDPRGRSTHERVVASIDRLRSARWESLYAGLLCTVDIANDPVETYTALLRHRPPMIDLLLPHATWASPPPGAGVGATPYGDWLVAVFDRWYSAPRRETGVRLFEEILSLVLGGRSHTEAIGLSAVDILVVETDGQLEQVDSLKVAYDGAAATGLNVSDHSFDAALAHPGIRARHGGLDALSQECRRCPIVQVCGGGLYAHRFRLGTGFDNPSVYCADLLRLIDHVIGRVRADLALLPADA
jgi:uncharacterized protein